MPRVPRAPRAAKPPRVCSALVTNAAYGRTDVCGLEEGHDKMLNPSPHRGIYRGMVWETWRDRGGRKHTNIIDQGEPFEEERLEGGKPIPHEVQQHMIDRATDERFGHQAGRRVLP
jgi:hypothetical protein